MSLTMNKGEFTGRRFELKRYCTHGVQEFAKGAKGTLSDMVEWTLEGYVNKCYNATLDDGRSLMLHLDNIILEDQNEISTTEHK